MRFSSTMLCALAIATFTSGCLASSRSDNAAPSQEDEPLEEVTDSPADSGARRCNSLNNEMTGIELLLRAQNIDALSTHFGDTVDLRLGEVELDELAPADATFEVDGFAQAHSFTSYTHDHTMNSRSCTGGSVIGTLVTSNGTFRVTTYVRGETATGVHAIEKLYFEPYVDIFAE